MTINNLPAIMGTVLIVARLALVGIYSRLSTERAENIVQAGALLIVVGAVLLECTTVRTSRRCLPRGRIARFGDPVKPFSIRRSVAPLLLHS